jgi:mRNA-degrading endonuclease toxin of MazEF toxin-antitoxin module
MTTFRRGDIVLVGFAFSDESGKKLRPTAVVSTSAYHRGRQEVVVAAITSNVKRRLFGDYQLADWETAGLLFPSLATGIIRTIKHSMVERKLGSLSKSDRDAFDRELRRILGL